MWWNVLVDIFGWEGSELFWNFETKYEIGLMLLNALMSSPILYLIVQGISGGSGWSGTHLWVEAMVLEVNQPRFGKPVQRRLIRSSSKIAMQFKWLIIDYECILNPDWAPDSSWTPPQNPMLCKFFALRHGTRSFLLWYKDFHWAVTSWLVWFFLPVKSW